MLVDDSNDTKGEKRKDGNKPSIMDWHWIHAFLHDFHGGTNNFAEDHAGNVTEYRDEAKSIRAKKSRNAGD